MEQRKATSFTGGTCRIYSGRTKRKRPTRDDVRASSNERDQNHGMSEIFTGAGEPDQQPAVPGSFLREGRSKPVLLAPTQKKEL
ncbi:hypothetical protein Trydic_g18927 [Trypoxylus dichotomus]